MKVGGHSQQFKVPYVVVEDSEVDTYTAQELIAFCEKEGAIYEDEGDPCVVVELPGRRGIIEVYTHKAVRRDQMSRDKKRVHASQVS